jgi:Uma2 family endonuclease
MSTITTLQPEIGTQPRQKRLPPLQNGDHLTRAEFERRYTAQPELKKAELIEGVVHMPSPVSIRHANIHANIMTWLGSYRAYTPGIYLADNVTIRLDLENEVQPDAVLYIAPEKGGQVRIEDKFLSGAPELVVEVAASSAAYDLHEKLRVYRRNGVQEYLVLLAHEQETRWLQLIEAEYRPLTPGAAGALHSQAFHGLRFQPDQFWADDLAGLLQVLQTGLDSPEHKAFVTKLRET